MAAGAFRNEQRRNLGTSERYSSKADLRCCREERNRQRQSAISFRHELANAAIRRLQRLLVGKEHDPEVLGACFLAEAGTVHSEHVLCLEQFLDELLVAVRNLKARECIERSPRRDATHARSSLAPLNGQVAAG